MRQYKCIKSLIFNGTEYKGSIETEDTWLEDYGIDVTKLNNYFLEAVQTEPKYKIGDYVKHLDTINKRYYYYAKITAIYAGPIFEYITTATQGFGQKFIKEYNIELVVSKKKKQLNKPLELNMIFNNTKELNYISELLDIEGYHNGSGETTDEGIINRGFNLRNKK